LPDSGGDPIISDFGEAYYGDSPLYQEVMPDLFRAPEIVLAIPWVEKIDIWSFGLMVFSRSTTDVYIHFLTGKEVSYLLEGKTLFTERLSSRDASSAAHVAKMISLLGPPPQDLLNRGNDTALFFAEDGKRNPLYYTTRPTN
jgi:hypothetical protein